MRTPRGFARAYVKMRAKGTVSEQAQPLHICCGLQAARRCLLPASGKSSIALECEAVEAHNERPYIALTHFQELSLC